MPTFGSLFAGIGGIDLGLERAGWIGRWQVEFEPFCQRVLAKHWPDVHRVGDVHDAHGAAFCPTLADADSDRDGSNPTPMAGRRPLAVPDAERCGSCPNCLPYVDLIAGGFPCQPVSTAGRRLIQADDRWLWPEFARCVRELGPRYVLVENVPGLLVGGGMDDVLGDLAELGYDTEWESIPAAAVGAPHLRYRVWIVAYRTTDSDRLLLRDPAVSIDASTGPHVAGDDGADGRVARPGDVAYPYGERQGRTPALGSPGVTGLRQGEAGAEPDGASDGEVADTPFAVSDGGNHHAGGGGEGWGALPEPGDGPGTAGSLGGWWSVEPDVGRVAHGVPARVDRLRSLGNAVVPQVVEWIGRRIIEA